jgi:hypothetical protein
VDFNDHHLVGDNSNNSNSTELSGYTVCHVTLTQPSLFSARCLSLFLAAEAKQRISPQDIAIYLLNDDEEECCSDSGATHHMLNNTKPVCCITLVLIELSPLVMSPPYQ